VEQGGLAGRVGRGSGEKLGAESVGEIAEAALGGGAAGSRGAEMADQVAEEKNATVMVFGQAAEAVN